MFWHIMLLSKRIIFKIWMGKVVKHIAGVSHGISVNLLIQPKISNKTIDAKE